MTIDEQHSPGHMLHLLSMFLGSKINIEPQALWFLVESQISEAKIEKFLKRVAFTPNFTSYVSWDLVQSEFGGVKGPEASRLPDPPQESLAEAGEAIMNEAEAGLPPDFADVGDLIDDVFSEMEANTSGGPAAKQTVLAPNPRVPVEENPILQPVPPTPPEEDDLSLEEAEEASPGLEYSPPAAAAPPLNKLVDSPPAAPSSPPEEESKGESQLAQIREQKRKNWESLARTSGTSTFRPKAADYESDIQILSDPTGKLYTEGKLDQFISVQQDKFLKLSEILKNRQTGAGLTDISWINRLENSTEVSFIGMVVDKRQTSNRNYLIQFEDMTGQCMTLVRQKSHEVYKAVDYLLQDHVVIVDGFLSVNPDTHSRIILVNDIYFPDAPTTHMVNTPEEDLAICFISDTHFGSKEWLEKVWLRFVDYLNCRVGNDSQREQAGKVKYLCIAGDLVDGIGVYPNQDKRLDIKDIYQQYDACAEYLSALPDYIKIIISPGDHDAVRKALPAPALPKDIAKSLYDREYTMVGNPAMLSLHGIKTQLYHGTSLIDLNMAIPGMSNDDPFGTMKELIRGRDLAPMYGKKTEIAPVEKNWLVLDTLPDILHTGHLHKNGYGKYHGILLINSGCFQAQTEFMESLGIVPDYGKPTIVNLKDQLQTRVINLVGDE